ncbi:MAG: hypothetical protein ABUT20_18240 [Bacteroidota bacterium]
MKKIIFLIAACCFFGTCFSQAELQKAIHKYYRYDPFDRSFSSFITNLLSDGALINKTVVKRTDSTLFFFKGEYKGHNPFGFKATRTEVRLAEMEIESSDSIPQKDTIMAYQILGYIDKTGSGTQAVKSELTKFDNKYGDGFSNKICKDLMEGNDIVGVTCNYFVSNSSISPLTIIWGNINASECIFAVTVRLVKIENQAMLPLVYDRNNMPSLQ